MDTLARLRASICVDDNPSAYTWEPFVLRENPRVIAATDGRSFAARECDANAKQRRAEWPDFQTSLEEWQPVRWGRMPRADLVRACGSRRATAPVRILRVGRYTFDARRVARALWAVGSGDTVQFGLGKRWTATDARRGGVSLYLRGPGWGAVVAEFLPASAYPTAAVLGPRRVTG